MLRNARHTAYKEGAEITLSKRSYGGPKEQDGLEGMHSADRCILTKLEKSRLYLLSPIHACPRHDPWAMCKQLSHVRAKSEFLTL